jgi:hypothetical protein
MWILLKFTPAKADSSPTGEFYSFPPYCTAHPPPLGGGGEGGEGSLNTLGVVGSVIIPTRIKLFSRIDQSANQHLFTVHCILSASHQEHAALFNICVRFNSRMSNLAMLFMLFNSALTVY